MQCISLYKKYRIFFKSLSGRWTNYIEWIQNFLLCTKIMFCNYMWLYSEWSFLKWVRKEEQKTVQDVVNMFSSQCNIVYFTFLHLKKISKHILISTPKILFKRTIFWLNNSNCLPVLRTVKWYINVTYFTNITPLSSFQPPYYVISTFRWGNWH